MEEFLKEQHAKDYTGTDDAMPDAFENWLAELSPDEWIQYGDEYASVKSAEAATEARERAQVNN
jgi:hypothetical protein